MPTCCLSFHPCFDTDVQIILGDRRLDPTNLKLIRNAKAIILPKTCPQEIYNACSASSEAVLGWTLNR
ncbi:MAG: hypothetical protein K8R45_12830 [Desulfobacterales bacterium]|nr:hypothetical protein [Desulfobacterales bacterium]